jgi:hypothetical protein
MKRFLHLLGLRPASVRSAPLWTLVSLACIGTEAIAQANYGPVRTTPPACTGTARNLIADPGFEGSAGAWLTSEGTARYTQDPIVRHGGRFSAKGVETHTELLGRLYQDASAIAAPGNEYVLSGWIKTQSVTGVNDRMSGVVIALDFVKNDGWTPPDGYVMEVGHVLGTHDWAFFKSPPFKLPPMPRDAVRTWALVDFNGARGTAWADDLQLISAEPCGKATSTIEFDSIPHVTEILRFGWNGTSSVSSRPPSQIWRAGSGAAASQVQPLRCLANKKTDLCTPERATIESTGWHRYHVVLPANQQVSIPNPTGARADVSNEKGRACYDVSIDLSVACNDWQGSQFFYRAGEGFISPGAQPGALVFLTTGGRTYFSMNGRIRNLAKNGSGSEFTDQEGYLEFDVAVSNEGSTRRRETVR